MRYLNQLKELLKKRKIDNIDEKAIKIDSFLNNLEKWNKSINLISKKSNLLEHVNHSLMFNEIIPSPVGALLDIGSGNGFPAIIITIVSPLKVTMVESTSKKCAFLKNTFFNLNLNCSCLNINFLNIKEQLPYDYVTIRGLKINKPIETKLASIMQVNRGKLLVYSHPAPKLSKFSLLQTIESNNKFLHLYTLTAQVEQQPI